jgi:hypothetical protein
MIALRPDAQGDQETPLTPAFERAPPPLTVCPPLPGGAQLREPDGVRLQDRRGRALVGSRGQGLELVQAPQQGALAQQAQVAVGQFALHIAQADTERTPALDLGVDIAADALVGPQPVSQVEGNDYVVPSNSQTKCGQRSDTSPSASRVGAAGCYYD